MTRRTPYIGAEGPILGPCVTCFTANRATRPDWSQMGCLRGVRMRVGAQGRMLASACLREWRNRAL